jgi:aryl-phospho-beta-D-glucosidase BglC (GH1 family)
MNTFSTSPSNTFSTEKDAEFFASLDISCLRLPLKYRHFEDDVNPFVIKEECFKHVDRVVDIVRLSIYYEICFKLTFFDRIIVRQIQGLHYS